MSDTPLDAMETWLRARLEDVHVALPGTVTTYSKDTRLATVKPSIRPRSLHGDVFDIPPIQGVPVIWPGSSDFTVQGTLKRGDRVLLVFSEASIGSWLRGSQDADAEDETRFSLQDAVAIPGLWPTGDIPKHPLNTAAWGLSSDRLEIGGTKAGKAVVKNASASLGEILQTMHTMLVAMDLHHTALNAVIPGYPSQVSDLTSLATKIGGLLE